MVTLARLSDDFERADETPALFWLSSAAFTLSLSTLERHVLAGCLALMLRIALTTLGMCRLRVDVSKAGLIRLEDACSYWPTDTRLFYPMFRFVLFLGFLGAFYWMSAKFSFGMALLALFALVG